MVFYFYVTIFSFKNYFRVYLLINHEEFQNITDFALQDFFLTPKYASEAFR